MIYSNLKKILAEKGLSVNKVASAGNFPRPFIQSLVDNDLKNLNISKLDKLCLYLEIPLHELLIFKSFEYYISYIKNNVFKIELTFYGSNPNEINSEDLSFIDALFLVEKVVIQGNEKYYLTIEDKHKEEWFDWVVDNYNDPVMIIIDDLTKYIANTLNIDRKSITIDPFIETGLDIF